VGEDELDYNDLSLTITDTTSQTYSGNADLSISYIESIPTSLVFGCDLFEE